MPASSAHVVGQSDDDSDEVTVVGSKSFLEDLSAEELQERLAVTSAQLRDRKCHRCIIMHLKDTRGRQLH